MSEEMGVNLNQANHCLGIGNFKKAKEILLSLLAEEPNSGELLFLTGYCLFCLGESDKALDFCIEALSHDWDPEVCNMLLGDIYMDMQRYVEAEECYLTSLNLNPQNAEVMAAYGLLMLKTGYEGKAAKLLEEAIRLEPENEVVLNYNFHYYLAKDKKDEQVRIIEQFLISSDSEVKKLVNIGLHDLFREEYNSARENFRQAFLLDPTNKNILQILNELDKQTHVLLKPLQFIDSLGGPAVMWFVFIISFFSLRALDLDIPALVLGMIYLIYVIYSWTVPHIYNKFIVK